MRPPALLWLTAEDFLPPEPEGPAHIADFALDPATGEVYMASGETSFQERVRVTAARRDGVEPVMGEAGGASEGHPYLPVTWFASQQSDPEESRKTRTLITAVRNAFGWHGEGVSAR